MADFVYLDIETLDWFQDTHIATLPRNQQLLNMRIGVAVTYKYADGYQSWWPHDIVALWRYLGQPNQHIVGWNIKDFDIPVLKAALQREQAKGHTVTGPPLMAPALMCFDMFNEIRADTGRWYRLDVVTQANLHRGKLADGARAVEWLTSGDEAQIALAVAYCQHDVGLCLDLHNMLRAGRSLLLPARPDREETEDLLWGSEYADDNLPF